MPDAILAWFYGHGVVGLFLTPLAMAIAYYVIPIACRSPLYSHTLSLVGFWTLLMIYTHIGTHHLLQTPVPTWLKVLAVVGSIGMLIPVMTVLVNLWLTMRGRLGYIHADIGGKFVMAGLVWYILTCIQGPLQALPIVQRVTHLNNWVIAHSHLGVLGFSGTIALGGIYFILPRLTGRPLYSKRLADVQYWLVLLGMTGFFMVLTAAGLIQGNGWLNGETVYRLLPEIHVYMVLRASIGLLIWWRVIGLYNVCHERFTAMRRQGSPPMRGDAACSSWSGASSSSPPSCSSRVVLPWTTISDTALGHLSRPRTASEEAGRHDLRPQRMHLLPHPVRPQYRLGSGRCSGSPSAGDYIADQPHLLGTERTDRISPRRAASTRTTGMWPISSIPVSPGPNRSCRRGSSWATERIRALIAYKQSLGFRMADYRMERQKLLEAGGHRGL